MNGRRLWNLHQRHKFLRAEAFRDNFLGNGISRGFQEVFSNMDSMLFHQNTRKTENNAIKISQAFHDITHLECFTDLKLFKYAFNVIQNWENYFI